MQEYVYVYACVCVCTSECLDFIYVRAYVCEHTCTVHICTVQVNAICEWITFLKTAEEEVLAVESIVFFWYASCREHCVRLEC